jgi:hypothetical protein
VQGNPLSWKEHHVQRKEPDLVHQSCPVLATLAKTLLVAGGVGADGAVDRLGAP